MYDAIVIGARVAGSPTAMLLARAGYRVLLVDRASFPSEPISTGFVYPPGVAQLKRWGLLSQLIDAGCPEVPRWTYNLDDKVALAGFPPPFAEGTSRSIGLAPRRFVLDQILLDAARASGAEVREQFTVLDLLWEGDQVRGIRGRTAGGTVVTEEAPLVIGADGAHSLVARLVQAVAYRQLPTQTCSYYSYWSGVTCDLEVFLHTHKRRFFGLFPTNNQLTCVFINWPIDEFHTVRRDLEGSFSQVFELVPGLAERMRQGKREEPILGTADLPNYFRKPYGPGWALVGDAGYHHDSTTGRGMTDALRDAELLALAVDAGWSGRQSLEEALATYERQRNAIATPLYDFICQIIAFEPRPADELALLAALRGNQEQIDRYLGTIAGTVPSEEFFSPENIGRIFAS